MIQAVNNLEFYQSLDSEINRIDYLENMQAGLSKELNKAYKRLNEMDEFQQEEVDEETFDILAGMFGAVNDFNNLLDYFTEHQSEVLTNEINNRRWQ